MQGNTATEIAAWYLDGAHKVENVKKRTERCKKLGCWMNHIKLVCRRNQVEGSFCEEGTAL
jgi:hypothetical protein